MIDLGIDLPKQEGKYISNSNGKYSCFGYSIRGSSHIAAKTPCQDYNNFEYLEDCGVIIACIADGVGSCPLSHWGAFVAVETALQFVKEKLSRICRGRTLSIAEQRNIIPGILREAFQKSSDIVEGFAAENNRPVSAFLSTLTLALYDGEVLCCEHVGDDGVVAQFKDGNIEMVTERIKGEEASSVYPLQSGTSVWEYSESGLDERGPVVAFTMVTDGILDKFVFEDDVFKQTAGCCSGVYYKFMAPMVYGDSRIGLDAKDSYQKMQFFLQKMNSENYRKQITDDLTLVSVVNLRLIKKSTRPEFDEKAFQKACNHHIEQQRKILYESDVKNKARAEPMQSNFGYQSNKRGGNDKEIDVLYLNRVSSHNGYRQSSNDKAENFQKSPLGLDFQINKLVLAGMASAILIIGILVGGIFGYRIANKTPNNKLKTQEVQEVQKAQEPKEKDGDASGNDNSGITEKQSTSENSESDDNPIPFPSQGADKVNESPKSITQIPEQSL